VQVALQHRDRSVDRSPRRQDGDQAEHDDGEPELAAPGGPPFPEGRSVDPWEQRNAVCHCRHPMNAWLWISTRSTRELYKHAVAGNHGPWDLGCSPPARLGPRTGHDSYLVSHPCLRPGRRRRSFRHTTASRVQPDVDLCYLQIARLAASAATLTRSSRSDSATPFPASITICLRRAGALCLWEAPSMASHSASLYRDTQ
jgi:hypothetical protein